MGESKMSSKTTMLKKLSLKVITLWFATGVSSFILFQNCGKGSLQDSSNDSSGVSSSALSANVSNAVVTTRQVFNSLLNVTQLDISKIDPAVLSTARPALANAVTDTGAPDSVNAPMWMSITNLSSLVCIDLVKDEVKRIQQSQAPHFFIEVNLWLPATAITDSAIKSVMRRMARGFWGRNETDEEAALILSTMQSSFADVRLPAQDASSITVNTSSAPDTNTSTMMYFLCSAMLSSLETHRR